VRRIPFFYKGETLHALVSDRDYQRFKKLGRKLSYKEDGNKVRPALWANGRLVDLSRWIMNARDQEIIDHKNGTPCDNRRSNLRRCTKAQNNMNTARRRNNTSGYKGVHKLPSGKFAAYICKDNKSRHLGVFETATAAARMYDSEATRLFGRFASPNFPRAKPRKPSRDAKRRVFVRKQRLTVKQ